jgi:glycosyltransferase involved in cell wall biosynthesis
MVMVLYSQFRGDARVRAYTDWLLAAGWRVHVICLREEGLVSSGGRISFHPTVRKYQGGSLLRYLLSYFVFCCWSFVLLSWLRLSGRCDFVHVHNLPDFIVLSALVPRLTGARVILDFHDTMPELYAAKFSTGTGGMLYRILIQEEAMSARFAHQLIASSEIHRRIFVQHGLPPERLSVVMNVANPALFPQSGPAASPPSEGGFTFIYHGTVAYRLGLDIALRAFAKARSAESGLRFSIIGDGDYMPDLLRLRDGLGLGDALTLSGRFLPLEELASHIAAADAGVIAQRADPSCSFALPGKLLEYARMCKPCIVSRLPITEFYFEEDMVCFFEPGNVDELAEKMLRVSRDRVYRETLARNISRFNEKYNWENQRKVYFDVLARCDGRAGLPSSIVPTPAGMS